MPIVLSGFVFLVLGTLLLTRGIRGRLVNSHPHCRGCGFDLVGLSLEGVGDTTSNCPECGRIVSGSEAAIRIGKRRRRRGLITMGVLVLLLGFSGVGWKPISRISGLQNINWYEYMPESMLVNLAVRGNTKSLDVLHGRLIPDELSEEGLVKLIDHALTLIDDETVIWDERWGNVIVFGMLESKLTHVQLDQYLRSTQEIMLDAHDLVGSDESEVYFQVGSGGTGLGSFNQQFLHNWKAATGGVSSSGISLDMRLNAFQFSIAVNGEPIVRQPRRGLGHSGGFSTSKGNHSKWHLDEEFPLTDSKLDFHIVMEFEIECGDSIVHKWEEELHHTFKRADHPITRVYPADDPSEIEEFIRSLHIRSVAMPINLDEGYKHERTRYFGYSALSIRVEGEHEISLVGDVYLQIGNQRFNGFYSPVAMTPRGRGVVAGGKGVGYKEGELDFFKRNRLFLMQMVLNESVDVVFVPNPEACLRYPNVSKYLSTAIVFRNVPVERYQPYYGDAADTDGNRWKEWRWEEVDRTMSPEPVHAEPVDEEDL